MTVRVLFCYYFLNDLIVIVLLASRQSQTLLVIIARYVEKALNQGTIVNFYTILVLVQNWHAPCDTLYQMILVGSLLFLFLFFIVEYVLHQNI